MNRQSSVPRIVALHRRLGPWLFSKAVCFKAPYFATISPRVVALSPGGCVARMSQRRRVTNHLGTLHAIALCNRAELVAELAAEAGTPAAMRWIPKGMQVDYLRKATGTMTASANAAVAFQVSDAGHALPVEVSIRDGQDAEVFRATVSMWISPRSRPGR